HVHAALLARHNEIGQDYVDGFSIRDLLRQYGLSLCFVARRVHIPLRVFVTQRSLKGVAVLLFIVDNKYPRHCRRPHFFVVAFLARDLTRLLFFRELLGTGWPGSAFTTSGKYISNSAPS